MRVVPLLVGLLIVGAALPATAEARNLWFEVQLSGSTLVLAGSPATFQGQLVFHSGQNMVPVALAARDVRLMVDGTTVAHATTDVTGHFTALVTFPTRGLHELTAAIDLLGADSNILRVSAVVPPTMLTLTGIQSSRWNYSHLDWTVDDGGYPPYQFRIFRTVNGGARTYAGAVGGFARSFEEPIAPGASVVYEVDANNFAGLSTPISVTGVSPTTSVDTLSSAMSLSWYCDCGSGGGGWGWYPTANYISSNHAFGGTPTISGSVSSLGSAAAGRVVKVSVTTWLTNYCYPGQTCSTTPIYTQSASGQATVSATGTYTVTLPQIAWTWGGGDEATSRNHWRATVTIDDLTSIRETSIGLMTDPCGPPDWGCGGGF